MWLPSNFRGLRFDIKEKTLFMKSPSTPEINAGSMADIAFLLVVFFLIATTIETDIGMFRKLPPDEEEKSQEIKKRNVLNVWVNADDQIMINGKLTPIEDLFAVATEFISNPDNLAHLPEKKDTRIDLIGLVAVSRQVISITNDKNTSYARYIEVQNELAKAYAFLRNQKSQEHFHINYDALKNTGEIEKMLAIKTIYPMRISEAKPVSTVSE